MAIPVSQSDAAELFGLPTVMLYVCDGKKKCGRPSCRDFSDRNTCHHTEDFGHALYKTHYVDEFEQRPAVRDGEAAIICVEPIR